MKQKRKYHELSDDDDTKSSLSATNTPNEYKRAKISLSSHKEQICDTEDEELWILRLPRHLNLNQLHDEKVSKKTYLANLKNSELFPKLDLYIKCN